MTGWPFVYTEQCQENDPHQPAGSLKVICVSATWISPACHAVRVKGLKSKTVFHRQTRTLTPLLPPCLSPVTDHELCGSVGRPGVCAGQGAVQRTQPCNPVWMYRRHCGAAARWLPAVLALPRPLRQDGRATVA